MLRLELIQSGSKQTALLRLRKDMPIKISGKDEEERSHDRFGAE